MNWNWNNLLTSFEGRIHRASYWGATLALAVVAIIVQWLLIQVIGLRASSIIALVFIYPAYAILIKRSNDRDRPQWIVQAFFALVAISNIATALVGPSAMTESSSLITIISMLLGLASLYVLVDFGCLRGTEGDNRHGPDPLAGRKL